MLLWLTLLAFCAALFPIVAVLCLCIYISAYRTSTSSHSPRKIPSCLGRSAAVVVLGDIGRSPRMCFHVESLANEGYKVAIVGYPGSTLPPALHRSSIRSHHLPSPPGFITRLPRKLFIIAAPFKLALQAISLFLELTIKVHPPPEVVLVQTPPALPTLLVVRLASALVKARVIIDWHNLAYTILALRLGERSKVVKIAEWMERWSGRKAYAHLFVTEAMKDYLSVSWGLKGKLRVLHDRPPAHFRRSTIGETHRLMGKLIPSLQPSVGDDFLPKYTVPESTPFTKVANNEGEEREGGLQWREDRPALVVSSTSWTADEDFGLLLRAARLYEYRARTLAETSFCSSSRTASPVHSRSSTGDDSTNYHLLSPISPSSATSTSSHFSQTDSIRTSKERRRASYSLPNPTDPVPPILPYYPAKSLPKLLIVVTGKGELKSRYLAEINHLETSEQWRFVRIRTAWLETEEYPVLLGSADVGVSLHTSSSGLDLPMKVVDMLGCGLPVCALDFSCLVELVRDGVNGLIFKDAEGLMRQWESLFARHPESKNWLSEGVGMKDPFELPGVGEVGMGGVPMSPNPSMTLLHSPGLTPSNSDGGNTNGMFENEAPPSTTTAIRRGSKSTKSSRSTWEGNWKFVMRPLVNSPHFPKDDDEDGDLTRSSALKLNTNTGGGGLLFQRRVKQGYAPVSNSSKGVRAYEGSYEDDNDDAGRREEGGGNAGFSFIPQAALKTDGESQKGLRQRKSVSSGNKLNDPLSLSQGGRGGGGDDDANLLPAIQVSKPPTAS